MLCKKIGLLVTPVMQPIAQRHIFHVHRGIYLQNAFPSPMICINQVQNFLK